MSITKREINRILTQLETVEAVLGDLSLKSDRENGEDHKTSYMLNTALRYLGDARETLEFGE